MFSFILKKVINKVLIFNIVCATVKMSSKYFNRRIPILLIGNDYRLLKSIKFQEHLYLGDPLNALRVFSEKSIDEMVIYFLSKNDISESFSYISTLLSQATFPLSIEVELII